MDFGILTTDFHFLLQIILHSSDGHFISVEYSGSQSGFRFGFRKNVEKVFNTAGAA